MNPFDAESDYYEETFKTIRLQGARIVGKEFEGCQFTNCSLRECAFVDCKFTDCTFTDCDLSALNVAGSAFSEVEFEKCRVAGVNWTLAKWSKFAPDAPIAFRTCTLDLSTFLGLTLRKLRVIESTAHDVDFSDTDLSQSDFRKSDLAQSRFQHTNLKRANFVGATNYTIDVKLNELKNARFSLPEAVALLQGLEIVLVES